MRGMKIGIMGRIRNKKMSIISILVIFVLYVFGLIALYFTGFDLQIALPVIPVSLLVLLVSYYVSKQLFEKLAFSDVKYIIEISDDFNKHTLYAVSSRAFKNIEIKRPIAISFGDIIYADYFDAEKLELLPTWVHEKIEFLRDKEALEMLKQEHEALENKYSRIAAIYDIAAKIEARKRIELIESLKESLLKEVVNDESEG